MGNFLLYVKSEVVQSCPTLCDPTDCSLPGSTVCGIFQARILEWVAISFSRYMSKTPPQNMGYAQSGFIDSSSFWVFLTGLKMTGFRDGWIQKV